jgi:hypothetical protein
MFFHGLQGRVSMSRIFFAIINQIFWFMTLAGSGLQGPHLNIVPKAPDG